MGILNLTPDSFSDGGAFASPEAALVQAQRMIADGAGILDIGAESTRPGPSTPVSAETELGRLAPVLSAVIALGVPVSIDSMKAEVVDWALRQGAGIVNDIRGLQGDGDMAAVVAAHHVPVIVMHHRATVDAEIDIMRDIADFFQRSLDIASRAGIPQEAILLDPGIGFGKTASQNFIALARLHELAVFDLPILVGASRKSFIASLEPCPSERRLGGSIAAHVLAAAAGARIIRTHDVAETVQALKVGAAIEKQK